MITLLKCIIGERHGKFKDKRQRVVPESMKKEAHFMVHLGSRILPYKMHFTFEYYYNTILHT